MFVVKYLPRKITAGLPDPEMQRKVIFQILETFMTLGSFMYWRLLVLGYQAHV